MSIALVGLNIGRSSQAIFQTWPADPEVQFVWQAALTNAAAYLDDSPQAGPVAVGGWTPDTMDPPTMALTLVRQDLSLRYFDPTQSLIIPAGQQPRLLRPAILPLEAVLEEQLLNWSSASRPGPGSGDAAFVYYQLSGPPQPQPDVSRQVDFGDEIRFLGYSQPGPGQWLTFWQVLERPAGPRRIFLHLLDENGQIITQDDRLGAPAAYWQPGDLLLQSHWLAQTGSEQTLHLGIYDATNGQRLLTDNGRDFVQFESSTVE